MNSFVNALNTASNFTYTENGALTHTSTGAALYDLYALGGAYRGRSDDDVVFLFKKAFDEDEVYALKCLFYLRDREKGQGERRFFRLCMNWLATVHPEAAVRNIKNIPLFGRWDDLYTFTGTPVHNYAFDFIKEQLALDVESTTPSLLAKWLKSENTSSADSRKLGAITRKHLNMTPREYRKTLSFLRKKINIVERLMSAQEWDKIEFDKLPSRAGFIYRNAFARHDIERAQSEAKTYAEFAQDANTKVNADVLYPYDCVKSARTPMSENSTQRLMINKYWDNLPDYFNGAECPIMCVCDTSGSMTWGRSGSFQPIDAAVGLSIYCAERNRGPFAGCYVSFASEPQFIKVEGVDFVDKVRRIVKTNLCDNTNIQLVFKLFLDLLTSGQAKVEDMPKNIVIISDMEFDEGVGFYGDTGTLMEKIRKEWSRNGYQLPKLTYWNVDARQDNIADLAPGVSYVSGASATVFEQIVTGKSGLDLMYDKLNGERYSCIK